MIRMLDYAGSTLVEWGRQQQQHVEHVWVVSVCVHARLTCRCLSHHDLCLRLTSPHVPCCCMRGLLYTHTYTRVCTRICMCIHAFLCCPLPDVKLTCAFVCMLRCFWDTASISWRCSTEKLSAAGSVHSAPQTDSTSPQCSNTTTFSRTYGKQRAALESFWHVGHSRRGGRVSQYSEPVDGPS